MTLSQARQLYIEAGGPDDHGEAEWRDIQKEMLAIVDAKSDRAAGKTILWWGCWGSKYTPTGFARRVRNRWNQVAAESPTQSESQIRSSESAVRSIGIVVPLSREELWLLCKALRQEAERMDEQAMSWRVEGENRKATGKTWQPHIKTAITAEGRARRKHDRVKELKAIFYGKRHNIRIS